MDLPLHLISSIISKIFNIFKSKFKIKFIKKNSIFFIRCPLILFNFRNKYINEILILQREKTKNKNNARVPKKIKKIFKSDKIIINNNTEKKICG